MQDLPQSSGCFVCGKDNPTGLNQRFTVLSDSVQTIFIADSRFCGYPGVVHGGIIASLLDETMGWACAMAKRHFFITADLKVRYLSPLPAGVRVSVSGKYLGDKVGLWLAEGAIIGDQGEVYATGSGRFAPAPEEANRRFCEDVLLFEDGIP